MSNKVPVTFINGVSSRKGVIGVLSFPNMLSAKTEFCRFFTFIDGNWGKSDLDFQCKSITSINNTKTGYRAWFILGKNGEVTELSATGRHDDQIPGAGLKFENPYGYVESINYIDGDLYVCGYGRQVYQQVNGHWLSIADSILTRETARGFFDIAGFDKSNIYAVGWKGEIFFYDGNAWHQDDSPTTGHLAAVRCLPNGDVWICGDKGLVLRGRFNHWETIESSDFTGNWYSIEEFEGNIYLAGNSHLARVEGDKIVPVNTGLNKPISTHRLHSRDGILWSFGENDILMFDGGSWQEIIHPDNA